MCKNECFIINFLNLLIAIFFLTRTVLFIFYFAHLDNRTIT